MGKFLGNLIAFVIVVVIALIIGMISPGQWLSNQRRVLTKMYNKTFRFSETPVAEGFLTTPFDLYITYVENTEGKLESYLVNTSKNEMLPVLEVEDTTQVGDIAHRFKGLGEEGRGKLQSILESVRDGGTSALDKALKLLGE